MSNKKIKKIDEKAIGSIFDGILSTSQKEILEKFPELKESFSNVIVKDIEEFSYDVFHSIDGVMRDSIATSLTKAEFIDAFHSFTGKNGFNVNDHLGIPPENLFQSIGSKDKNGNDIFDGSILEYEGRCYLVVFNKYYGVYGLLKPGHKDDEKDSLLGHSGSSTKYSPYLWNWLSKKVLIVGHKLLNGDKIKLGQENWRDDYFNNK